MAPVVVGDALSKRFGSLLAVDNLSFELEPGTITGFLGPNGAGKTTTLRMLLGLATPTSGRALVFGEPYSRLEHPGRRIGAVLEATDFHPGRSGRNHLRMLSDAAGLPRSRVEDVLRIVELESAAARRVKGYSLGMRQRLGLAAALLGDPELLILDEPANGLDPEGVRWLREFLRSFAADQRTVLISSHVLAEVAQTVDQVLIINRGKLVVESSLEQLTSRVGGSVRVRTPESDKLAEALRNAGIEVTTRNDHALLAHGTSSARVGDVAFAAGVPVHELFAESESLEEVFLELTSGGCGVTAQLRSELLKIRSTRTALGLAIGMVALVLLFSLLSGLLTKIPDLTSTEDQRGLLGVGSTAGVFSALAGIMLVTSEYRHGTIRPTYLVTPRRSRVLIAKLIAGLLAGLVAGIVGEGLGFALGYAALSGRGIHLVLTGGQLTLLLLGTLAGTALWGAIGVGIGAIVRSQVGGIIGLLAWGFVVENLLFAFVPAVGRFAPVHAQDALMGLTTHHLLPATAGALVLIAWTVALALVGVALAARRDVD